MKTRVYAVRLLAVLGAVAAVAAAVIYMGRQDVYLKDSPVSVTDFKLNTFVNVALYSTGGHSNSELKGIAREAVNLCDKYEAMFSRTKEGSELYRLNSGEIDVVGAELGELIRYGLEFSQLSGGEFDVTIGAVSELWDFNSETPRVPEADAVAEAVNRVDYRQVSVVPLDDAGAVLDGAIGAVHGVVNEGDLETMSDRVANYRVTMPKGCVIDLGAVAKGYIADRIKEYLISCDINNAIINLGGNVLAFGCKAPGKDFNIGIKKPFAQDEVLTTVKVKDKSVVTSGVYERMFTVDDKLYHHILDPKTGYPIDSELVSVTIVSEESLMGDLLSTTCFALGKDRALELIDSMSDIEAMLVDKAGNISYSSGWLVD